MEITLSNLAVKHLLEELSFLKDGFVNNIQSLDNGWVKMKIHTKAGDKNLIITSNALFVSNYSLPAKQNPGGFSALLKKYLFNQRIISMEQHGADRIIVFSFPTAHLVLELFAKGNLILCDEHMKIIKAMRKEEWKDRALKQGEEYKFPSSKGTNPLEETLKDFEKKISENKKTFFGASIDALNTSPAILETIFDELSLDKKKDSASATSKEVKALLEKIKEIYSSKSTKAVLVGGALYTTHITATPEKEFDSLNSALNVLLINDDSKKEIRVADAPAKEAVKKQEKYEKETRGRQNQLIGLAVAEKEAQEKGEKLFLHYAQVKELIGAVNKAKQKGLSEKETIAKINAISPIIKELDFKKNKLVITLK